MHQKLNPRRTIFGIVLMILITGCDEEKVRIAREAADRQAEQNRTMAELQKEVASGTRKLAEADAQARKEIVAVHRDLQAERLRLDANQDSLEIERRQIARERRTESALIPAVQVLAAPILVIVLLGFCWYALIQSRRDSVDAELNDLLIREIAPDEPAPLVGGMHRSTLLGHSQPTDQRAD